MSMAERDNDQYLAYVAGRHASHYADCPICRAPSDPEPTYVRVFQDRYSGEQTLVTIHPDGSVALATREKPWHSWGPPHELKEEETHS